MDFGQILTTLWGLATANWQILAGIVGVLVVLRFIAGRFLGGGEEAPAPPAPAPPPRQAAPPQPQPVATVTIHRHHLWPLFIVVLILGFLVAALQAGQHDEWRKEALAGGPQQITLKSGKIVTVLTNGEVEDIPLCARKGFPDCPPEEPIEPKPTSTPNAAQIAAAAKVEATNIVAEALAQSVRETAQSKSNLLRYGPTPTFRPQPTNPPPTATQKATATNTPNPTAAAIEAKITIVALEAQIPPTPSPEELKAQAEDNAFWQQAILWGKRVLVGLAALLAVVGLIWNWKHIQTMASHAFSLVHGAFAILGFIGKGLIGLVEPFHLLGKLPSPYGAIAQGLVFLTVVLLGALVWLSLQK